MDSSNQWGKIKPNLSKLPAHVRENLTKPIDLRPGEFRSKVVIYAKTPGLQHPNGRVYIQAHQKDVASGSNEIDGLQIDVLDFSGRHPLVTLVVPMDKVKQFLQQVDAVMPNEDGIPRIAVPELPGTE